MPSPSGTCSITSSATATSNASAGRRAVESNTSIPAPAARWRSTGLSSTPATCQPSDFENPSSEPFPNPTSRMRVLDTPEHLATTSAL
jgi:hypothetical protein